MPKAEIKVNIKRFAERFEISEAHAWEGLLYGCVGHDPPWHIVNGTIWNGPLQVEREKATNHGLCINEKTGYQVMLSRGRKGKTVPFKNQRCMVCMAIILEEKAKLNGSN